MKKFLLPGYLLHDELMRCFLNYIDVDRSILKPDCVIEGLYDCPPYLIWNGGRFTSYITQDPNVIQEIFNIYRTNNVTLYHTFTNLLLTPEMCLDYSCNDFMKNWVLPSDKLIVASKPLEQYLKEHYPQNQLVYSTILQLGDINYINQITEKDICVLDYNHNIEPEFLQQLTHPEHIELMCNEGCISHCPVRHKDFICRSKQQLHIPLTEEELYLCPGNYYTENITFSDVLQNAETLTNERIEELSQMGFQYFKISGRHMPEQILIEVLLYYLIKEDSQLRVREILHDHVFEGHRSLQI